MPDDAKARTRREVLEVAARILERDGVRAVSTRSVAAAAGIRAASLYQLFGDKDGLLSALAVHAFDLYLARKEDLGATDDPVADMRRGWDAHVRFGREHPALYLLMYGTDQPGRRPPAADRARLQLQAFLDHAAETGHLRVPPALAADLLVAGVSGATLALIGDPAVDGAGADDRQLSERQLSDRMREAVIDAVTTPGASGSAATTGADLATRAVTLGAALRATPPADLPLRPAETALLHEWLEQLAP